MVKGEYPLVNGYATRTIGHLAYAFWRHDGGFLPMASYSCDAKLIAQGWRILP